MNCKAVNVLNENVFEKRLEDLEPITKDELGIHKTNLNDYVMIHYENKKRTQKTDYIGRVVRSFTRNHPADTRKKEDIEILWERNGEVYKSHRLSKKQPEWVKHTKEKHFFVDTISYVLTMIIHNENGGFQLTNYRHSFSTMRMLTIDEECRQQQMEFDMDYDHIDNRINGKGIIFKYYKLPQIVYYLKTEAIINNEIGPKEAIELLKIIFNKCQYDIYRNIVSYL